MTNILTERPFAGLGCAILNFCEEQLNIWVYENGKCFEETRIILEPLVSNNAPEWNIMRAFHECLYGIFHCSATRLQSEQWDTNIRNFEHWRWDMQDSRYRVGDTHWPAFIRERVNNKFYTAIKWMRAKEF